MADIYYDITSNKVVGLNLKTRSSDIDMIRVNDELLPNISKIVTKKGQYVHKRDSKGKPLYIRENIDPKTGKLVGTDIMDKPYMYNVVSRSHMNTKLTYMEETMDTINDIVYEVTEKEKLEYSPYIAKEDKDEIVNIVEEPTYFTIDEVLFQKYRDMVNASNLTYILAFHSATDTEDISLLDSEFMMVNAKGVVLLPDNFIELRVPLTHPTNKFRLLELSNNNLKVYLEGNLLTDSSIEFTGNLDKLIVTVKNETNQVQVLQSVALGHN